MQIIVRAFVMFVFLWFCMQVMGRKELAQISPFELVLLVVMGDLVQQGVTQQDSSVVGAMLAVGTFVASILALSYVTFRFKRTRDVIEGRPVVLVRDGRPLPRSISYERLTLDDVKDAAREQGIADLRDVRIGLLESDGKFSFIKFDESRPHEDEKTEAM